MQLLYSSFSQKKNVLISTYEAKPSVRQLGFCLVELVSSRGISKTKKAPESKFRNFSRPNHVLSVNDVATQDDGGGKGVQCHIIVDMMWCG